MGARYSKHFLTDCYARGVTRGAVEATNLLTRLKVDDPVSAETIRTSLTASLIVTHGLALLDAASTGKRWPTENTKIDPEPTHYQQRKIRTTLPWWTAYGHRGKDPRVHELSPYEFIRLYHFIAALHPTSLKDIHRNRWHAHLTAAGTKKLEASSRARLEAGLDYRIQDKPNNAEWIPMTVGDMVEQLRHDWIIQPRDRPRVPVILGTSVLHEEEDQAKLLLILFRPFTLSREDASQHVPFIADIKTGHMRDWKHALRIWLSNGLPTEYLRRALANFCFVHFMPRTLASPYSLEENSDNEITSDEEIDFDEADLLEAVGTRVRGAGKTADEETERDGNIRPTPLFAMTMQVFSLARSIWLRKLLKNDTAHLRHITFATNECLTDQEVALQAARTSRRKQITVTAWTTSASSEASPSARRVHTVSRADLLNWLHSDTVLSTTNKEQHHFLSIVVNRVIAEYDMGNPTAECQLDLTQPLSWLLHGPPGTGKTHVLQFLRQLFQEKLGYTEGIDFIVSTFQAVNAADVKGCTIHQAFGLNIGLFNKDTEASTTTSKRLAHLRWVIIDEISMVSARLLAQLERRLREVVPTASKHKCNADGQVRPFAGTNVIFMGDFHQLPPPEGGSIADIPHHYRPGCGRKTPDYLVEAGKKLFWEGSVQGVTELHQKERCKDMWWNEVVDELRSGRSSRHPPYQPQPEQNNRKCSLKKNRISISS